LEGLLEFFNGVIREGYKHALEKLLSVYEGKVPGIL
jgi:hypothetical protein